jgi:hypothetical protein
MNYAYLKVSSTFGKIDDYFVRVVVHKRHWYKYVNRSYLSLGPMLDSLHSFLSGQK